MSQARTREVMVFSTDARTLVHDEASSSPALGWSFPQEKSLQEKSGEEKARLREIVIHSGQCRVTG